MDDLTEAAKKQAEHKENFQLFMQQKDRLILKQTCLKCACILYQGHYTTEVALREAKRMYKALQEEW